jgi:hypothetical protein
VFVHPPFDFARIPIRSAVAVRPTAIVFLEPPLIFALELLLEDDAANVSPLFAEPLLLAQEGAIELGVVSEFAWPADARVVLLTTLVVAVAPVRVDEATSPLGEDERSLVSVERHRADQPFITQVPQIVVPSWFKQFLARTMEVALRDNPKRADRRERATVFAVDLVRALAFVLDQLALEAAGKVEVVEKHVAWVAVALQILLATVLVAVAWFVVPS